MLMTFRIAFRALARNKLRTGLTMLGMIIGVAAVITMVALGSGAQAAIEEQIRGAGTNMITVFPGSVNTGGVRQGGGTARLLPADAKVLRDVPEVEYVSEGLQSRQQVISSNQNWSTNIVGVNVDYTQIKSWPMKYGAFFTDNDVQRRRESLHARHQRRDRTSSAKMSIRRASRSASATSSSRCSVSWRRKARRPQARTRMTRSSRRTPR